MNNETGPTAALTGDARQGQHLAVIEYKDAGESVLETHYALVGPAEAGLSASAAEIGGAATVTGSFTVQ